MTNNKHALWFDISQITLPDALNNLKAAIINSHPLPIAQQTTSNCGMQLPQVRLFIIFYFKVVAFVLADMNAKTADKIIA